MARNGSGVMSIPNPDFVASTTIESDAVDANFSTIVDEITNSIAADGQTTPTANLPMGGFKLTGLGSGSSATDSVHLRDVQYQAWAWGGTATGTDTIAISPSPAIAAYAAGQRFLFQAGSSDNTGAATLNVNAVGAKAIQNNGSALAAGDIKANDFYGVVYDGTQFQLYWLGSPSSFARTLLDDADASTARNTLELNGRTVYAGTVGGTADAIALTTGLSLGSLTNGDIFVFFAGGNNTTNVTVNVDSIGATAVNINGTALPSDAIKSGDVVIIAYDGTDFELVSPRRVLPDTTELISTDAGAGIGPVLRLYRNSASPAASDAIGQISFAGEDSAGNKEFYANITAVILDETSGTEDSELRIQTAVNGTTANRFRLANGLFSVNATGGDQGADTINAGAFYDDGDKLSPGASLVAAVEDQKTSVTDGGTFTSGADRTRDLNTEAFDLFNLVSIASNQFTLKGASGRSYIVKWSAPGKRCDNHQSFLYDITNTTEIARGTAEIAGRVTGGEAEAIEVQTRSEGAAQVSPSSDTTYEIRHRCQTTSGTEGFGAAAGFGTNVYTRVEIHLV